MLKNIGWFCARLLLAPCRAYWRGFASPWWPLVPDFLGIVRLDEKNFVVDLLNLPPSRVSSLGLPKTPLASLGLRRLKWGAFGAAIHCISSHYLVVH